MKEFEWKAGKKLVVDISPAASKALSQRTDTLFVQLELYFSCLIRKRVLIAEIADTDRDYIPVHDRVSVGFSPVMTKACSVDPNVPPELVAFPIKKPDAYLPKWMKLDFQRGEFVGEFGY
jgi:hypothetical protein